MTMFAPGSVVRGYEIVRSVKDGGMATLFLARRAGAHGFSRNVAIKVMHPHLVGRPAFVQMFIDEAILGSYVSHPNIAHVEEFAQEENTCFLVMEYVSGCSVAELTRYLATMERHIEPALAVHIAVKVAEALDAAHEAVGPDGQALGVVHRDVTPGNILLSKRGHVKVIDFGIAQSELQNEAGQPKFRGKLRYMSPEQASGGALDCRSDVYSLALVLWELLVGKRAFDGPRAQRLLEAVRSPSIPPPDTFATLPSGLSEVVMKALSPKPDERYPTAREFRAALLRAVPRAAQMDASELAEVVRSLPLMGRDSDTDVSGNGPFGSIAPPRRSSAPPPPPPPASDGEIEIDITMNVSALDSGANRALSRAITSLLPREPKRKGHLWTALAAAAALALFGVIWAATSGGSEEERNNARDARPTPAPVAAIATDRMPVAEPSAPERPSTLSAPASVQPPRVIKRVPQQFGPRAPIRPPTSGRPEPHVAAPTPSSNRAPAAGAVRIGNTLVAGEEQAATSGRASRNDRTSSVRAQGTLLADE